MAYEVSPSFVPAYIPRVHFESLPPEGVPHIGEGKVLELRGIPKRGILRSSHKKLPDMFYFSGSYVVCEKFREIVERLEPGVHQFFPFEIVTKKGDPVPGPGPFYMLNVTQKLDAVLVSKSNIIWVEIEPEHLPGKKFPRRGRGPLQLVMSRPKIAGHHMWYGDKILGSDLYFSDALVKEVKAARLKKLDYTHVEETDEIWSAEENLTPK